MSESETPTNGHDADADPESTDPDAGRTKVRGIKALLRPQTIEVGFGEPEDLEEEVIEFEYDVGAGTVLVQMPAEFASVIIAQVQAAMADRAKRATIVSPQGDKLV